MAKKYLRILVANSPRYTYVHVCTCVHVCVCVCVCVCVSRFNVFARVFRNLRRLDFTCNAGAFFVALIHTVSRTSRVQKQSVQTRLSVE